MPSFNKVVLVGRLTRDPELRYTASGLAVVSFSIAVDRRAKDQNGERKTDFFRCTAWRQTAEFVSQYVAKGRLVLVEGSVEINAFMDNAGAQRQSVDIQCFSVETLEAPRDGANANGNNGGPVNAYPDDDYSDAPTPQEAAPQAPPQRAPQGQAPPRQPAPAAARSGNAAPQRAAAPAVPAPDDWDDTDPFADQ